MLGFLLVPLTVFAGIRPSFMLDSCAWKASHIVIATEGDVIDGNLSVLESLKGDLRIGESIVIADFAGFNNPELRQVGTEMEFLNFRADQYRLAPAKRPNRIILDSGTGPQQAIRRQAISCSRFVLFLMDEDSGSTKIWKPAAPFGGFFVSAVWLESHGTYGFYQTMNPGPSELVKLYSSESRIRELITEIIKAQDSLGKALAITEKAQRAEALEPLMRTSSVLVKRIALEEIGKCWPSARPVFLRLMQDTSMLDNSIFLFASYIETGDEQAGPELTAMVRQEFKFWKEMAPKLPAGWWRVVDKSAPDNLQNRYDRIYYLLGALTKLRFVGCKELIIELREFWRSQPVLGDSYWLKQLNRECDKLLAELQRQ